jgi:uncharacterized protein (DUF2267 family)
MGSARAAARPVKGGADHQPRRAPLPADEFVERVARELNLSTEEARTRVRAVFGTLREAVSWGELEDVVSQLDPEYADLLA